MLTYKNMTLKQGRDYEVSYKNNIKLGTGEIVINGKGNYKGEKTKNFNIGGSEVPLYHQNGSDWKKDGITIKASGCGIVSYAMVLSYLCDEYISPEDLADKYYGKYFRKSGTDDKLFLETAKDYGLIVKKYWSSDAWNQNAVMTALRKGQPVIVQVNSNSPFSYGRHYIVLAGLTEDGKIIVNDPDSNNYDTKLKNQFKYGFEPTTFSNALGSYDGYYIFDVIPEKPENPKTPQKVLK